MTYNLENLQSSIDSYPGDRFIISTEREVIEIMKLKRISEVCKITGVTRKALLGYEREGLVKPTNKLDSGYREYNYEAIWQIIFVKMMMEAGYKRKEIKKIIENPSTNIVKVYDDVIDRLEKKKLHIEGMIIVFKNQKWSAEHAQNRTFEYSEEVFFKGPLGNNFIEWWNKSVELASSEATETIFDDTIDPQRILDLFGSHLVELTMSLFFSDEEPHSPHIQNLLNNCYEKILEAIADYYSKEGYSAEDAYETAKKDIKELLMDNDGYFDSMKPYYGEEAILKLETAIQAFTKNL